jgi:hypothetical protein
MLVWKYMENRSRKIYEFKAKVKYGGKLPVGRERK